MRIAITGATGFCGSATVDAAYASGLEVIPIGRKPGSRHWDATTGDPDLSGADAVIHFAAAVGDPRGGGRTEQQFRAVNVEGTKRLFRVAGRRPVIWVSSASVYRPGPYPMPITEDHPTDQQRSAYGRTKAAGERIALANHAVVVRPRAVYGSGDPHLLPRLQRLVRNGRAWLPGPDVALSLTAVENLASACLAALQQSWPPGAYNVADATPYRRDEAIEHVLGVPVRHLPIRPARAVAMLNTPLLTRYALDQVTDGLVLDIGKARSQGWEPTVSLFDTGSTGRSSSNTSRPRRSW